MLSIDVGNTHIAAAVFLDDRIQRILRMETGECRASGSFLGRMSFPGREILQSVVIASVCDDVVDIILGDFLSMGLPKPMIVTRDMAMGITNLYHTKESLGVDRLINAAAAYALNRASGQSLVVVDMGTATTIDYVTGRGEFLGGAIVPGILSAYRGLIESATALPEIEISCPGDYIGQNTCDSLRSGIVLSHTAMIKGMAEQMAAERGECPRIIITGGLCSLLKDTFPVAWIMDPDLTLKGLYTIYKENRALS